MLGFPVRQATLIWRQRRHEQLVEAEASGQDIEQAALDIDAAEHELEAGRSLDDSEKRLLQKLQDTGATTLEIWILFVLSDVRRPSKPLWGHWQPLTLAIYAFLVLLVSTTTLLVSYSAARQMLDGSDRPLLWVLKVGAFLLVFAAVGDLYFRRAPAVRWKWRHVIEPSPRVSGTSKAP